MGKAKVSGREGYAFRAAVFDMDGVVTRTADLHAAAWKELFDAYLEERLGRGQPGFKPFDIESDYRSYVDGKPRHEGVRSFLATRGITLPYGEPADEPAQETIRGLGNRKDEFFERRLRAGGAQRYGSTVALIQTLRANGIRTALVTSSRHGREVLHSAGVCDLFDIILDGADADRLELQGRRATAKRDPPEPGIRRGSSGMSHARWSSTVISRCSSCRRPTRNRSRGARYSWR